MTSPDTQSPEPLQSIRIDHFRLHGPGYLRVDTAVSLVTTSFSAAHAGGLHPACKQQLLDFGHSLLVDAGLFSPAADWFSEACRSGDSGRAECMLTGWTVLLQWMTYDPVGAGRVLHDDQGKTVLVIPWIRAQAITKLLPLAAAIIQDFMRLQDDSAVDQDGLRQKIQDAIDALRQGALAPNTVRFALAARRRGHPLKVHPGGVIQIGWGAAQQRMDSSFTGATSVIGTNLARRKYLTGQWLRDGLVPVPRAALVPDFEAALNIAGRIGWPVVVKPENQDQGLGVATGIQDAEALKRAFETAAKYSPHGVMVEKHHDGLDHRMLVVGGRMIMATQRIPGGVAGDGSSTIAELVELTNADPRRGKGKRSLLMALSLDDASLQCLSEQGFDKESVPAAGQFVPLCRIANISRGGTALDVTAMVHPDNRLVAERAARLLGLDIAGVDFLCPDISRSWHEVGGVVCEVNAQPGFRPHWLGDPARDINGEILDWMFRDRPSRIPVAAITGTNGKTTTARMLHHLWLTAGKRAGVCTTSGAWIGAELVSENNLAGISGTVMLLGDPAVEAAILEIPRQTLIEHGQPCDRYQVAALLNVQDDHVGVDGIRSLDEMAVLKAGLIDRASDAVILNADDPRVMSATRRTPVARRILVSMDEASPVLQQHLAAGGRAVFRRVENDRAVMMIVHNNQVIGAIRFGEIPATMQGLLRLNEQNAMFAAALAWGQGMPVRTLQAGLSTFTNTPQHNPGRYNFIPGFDFQLMLDFGHNPDGVREVCRIANALPVAGARRLVNVKLGNRHASHLDAVAESLARTFNDFVLSCDAGMVAGTPDWQGEDPAAAMLGHGRDCLLAQAVASEAIRLEPDPVRAIMAGMANARAGDLLVILAEPWMALPVILSSRKKEKLADG